MPASRPVTKSSPRVAARKAYSKVPRKTTADDPNSYTKHPHEYGDLLIRANTQGQTKLGGALQRDLVYWIERNTWGKNIGTPQKVERPEFAKLSLSDLAKLCGSDRRTVARSLADLERRQIIQARDRADLGPNAEKMYKLTPERWKKAAYYDPNAEHVCRPRKQEPAENGAESTVAPGKVSKPQPVAVSPSKGAPAVTVMMVYEPLDFPFPVAFTSRPRSNGRVHVTCRATAPHRFAPPSPTDLVVSVEDAQVSAYRKFVSEFVLNFWGKSADDALISSIVAAANGAPVSVFERIVLEKFKRSRTGTNHSTGLLRVLAADAAKAWKEIEATRPPAPVPPTAAEIEAQERELAEGDRLFKIEMARYGK